ncbi:MAG: hypothetical protein AB4050_18750 [Synechococcus sp.]
MPIPVKHINHESAQASPVMQRGLYYRPGVSPHPHFTLYQADSGSVAVDGIPCANLAELTVPAAGSDAAVPLDTQTQSSTQSSDRATIQA